MTRSLIVVMLGVMGCPSGPGTGVPDTDAGMTLEVATGETGFETLTDTVLIEMGPQGGYHLWHAAVVCGMTGPYALDFRVIDVASETVVSTSERLDLAMMPSDDCELRFGMRGLLDTSAMPDQPFDPPALAGREVRIEGIVTDSNGAVRTDSRTVDCVYEEP